MPEIINGREAHPHIWSSRVEDAARTSGEEAEEVITVSHATNPGSTNDSAQAGQETQT